MRMGWPYARGGQAKARVEKEVKREFGEIGKVRRTTQQLSTELSTSYVDVISFHFMFFRSNALRRGLLGRRWLRLTVIAVGPTASLGLRQQPALISARPSEPVIVLPLSVVGRVCEYVLTAKRFIYLLFLFIPVLISSPMLLVGKSNRANRWGAIWWYGLLVSRMESAGPTFIKVP